MKRVIAGVFASILLVTVGSLAAACGDNGDELTLEDYLMRVEVLVDDLAERTDSEDPFAEAESAASVGDQGEILANFFADFGEAVAAFGDDLAALDPPEEARNVHNELLEESQAFAENVGEAVDRLEGATSEADIEAAFSLLDEAGDPEDACNDLQAIADENEISVALNCELA